MLAAPNRLRSRRDITRAARRGRFVANQSVMVRVVANHLPRSRAVVVVSKKVSKKAVVRNRIRRRVAAELARVWETVAAGYDIVITIRDDVTTTAPSELSRQLATALRRAGVYGDPV